jgi:hypothetical protein
MPRFLAMITITIVVISSNQAYPVDPHVVDRDALLSFKSCLQGNYALRDWGSHPVCHWHGVLRDSRGRVIALGITYANLTGVIPPAIGNLSSLETLNLDYNNLLGRIPMEFGKLSRLKWLGLSGNHLEGVIPERLGLLKGIHTLEQVL